MYLYVYLFTHMRCKYIRIDIWRTAELHHVEAGNPNPNPNKHRYIHVHVCTYIYTHIWRTAELHYVEAEQ